ncbi:MAG TPA: hypothetical protein VJK47_00520 [Dehalococcoidales bacterium]|nr:hypothetical protein [Dehalococcoidales bacterium]
MGRQLLIDYVRMLVAIMLFVNTEPDRHSPSSSLILPSKAPGVMV